MQSHASTQPALMPAFFGASAARSLALVVAGTAVLAISAKIQVPFWPVPLTLQGFAVMMIGATYGSRLAVATLLSYIAAGMAGLPVFAGPLAGPAYLLGPTAGYIWGWVVMAGIIGLAVDRGASRSIPVLFAVLLFASAIDFALGLIWLGAAIPTLGYSNGLLEAGLYPFVLGDLLKITLAALLVPATWRLVGRLAEGKAA